MTRPTWSDFMLWTIGYLDVNGYTHATVEAISDVAQYVHTEGEARVALFAGVECSSYEVDKLKTLWLATLPGPPADAQRDVLLALAKRFDGSADWHKKIASQSDKADVPWAFQRGISIGYCFAATALREAAAGKAVPAAQEPV